LTLVTFLVFNELIFLRDVIMINHDNLIHDEFILQSYNHGIKTIRPQKLTNLSDCQDNISVSTLFKSAFCLYFLNTQSQHIYLNQEALYAAGFDSMQQARGKTILDVSNEEIATQVIAVHKKVMRLQQPLFIEKELFCKDSRILQCLAGVFPWYNESNRIVGVFGSCVIYGSHSLSLALNTIFNLAFLNKNQRSLSCPKRLEYDIYLSTRENQCARLLMQGYSAKMIAETLRLSYRTVEHYIDNIKDKLGVSTKQELIYRLNLSRSYPRE
jgi:DNA-binding CsgD family transcriptional regulator